MIELLVLDVDGCMTDGSIIYTQNGDEIKAFNVKDGLAIVSWIRMGKKVAIITGRESKIVEKRARELGIQHLRQGIRDKERELKMILEAEKLTFDNVAVIGDDLNDYHMLRLAKRSFTPANGVAYIQALVQTVLGKKGGDGCIREMIDIIVAEEGLEEEFLKQWL
ncbi:MAG: 3-deoxy-D-manno-octulosonate 8-phosphate phosphatase [Sulfurospirillum sp.]|nr:MAG: 3-deoxy-D-manno-octulosonate 8-phosphate phosphatase [Sulfurospirillum sp.]